MINLLCWAVNIILAGFACQWPMELDQPTRLNHLPTPGQIAAPIAGMAIVIEPRELFGEGLFQCWQSTQTDHNQLKIEAWPLSKIRFQLTPVASDSGAVIDVEIDGTSVGETSSATAKYQLLSDSITKYSARRTVFLDRHWIGFSDLQLNVETEQELVRTKSKKGAGIPAQMASFAIKAFPKKVRETANQIARHQVSIQLERFFDDLQQRYHDLNNRLSTANNEIANFDWQFSSDEHRIYVATSPEMLEPNRQLSPNAAISIAVSDQFASAIANCWSGQTIDANHLHQLVAKEPPSSIGFSASPLWSARLGHSPITIEFLDNYFDVTIRIAEFQSEGRKIENVVVKFSYQLELVDHSWHLRRVLNRTTIETQSSGARQQIVRSILRKRLEASLSEHIPLPDLNKFVASPFIGELVFENIQFVYGMMFVSISKRK